MLECLSIASLSSDEEITQMLTTAMRKAESDCKSQKISHFESTLRLQYYYHPSQQQSSSPALTRSTPMESSINSCEESERMPAFEDGRKWLHAIVTDNELEDTLDIIKTLSTNAKQSTVKNLERKLTKTVTLLKELNLSGPQMEEVRHERQLYLEEIDIELQKLERNRHVDLLHSTTENDLNQTLDVAKTLESDGNQCTEVEPRRLRTDSLLKKAVVDCPDKIPLDQSFVAENDEKSQKSTAAMSKTTGMATVREEDLEWNLTIDAAVGIDLGTTYSCVSVYKDGRITVIPDEHGNKLVPSVVAFQSDGGEIKRLVGRDATENLEIDQSHVVTEVKRLMGRKFDEPAVQANIKRWPFQVTANTDGNAQISMHFEGHGLRQFSPEDISSTILTKMKKMAEDYLGKEVEHAVITVPANYNDLQRKSTMEAARLANLKVLNLMNEPCAAALAYGIRSKVKQKRHILVMDVGGGTSDVALIEVQDENLTLLASEGDNNLGGEDFDTNLVNYCTAHIKQGLDPDVKMGKLAIRRIRNKCEQAKVRLSENPADPCLYYVIELEDVETDMDFVLPITRNEFEEFNHELFKKAIGLVTSCLKAAKLSPSEISDIVPVGGSMRIPKLREMLQDTFDGRHLYGYINPDEAVSVGAAILAAQTLQIYSGHINLREVTPFSLVTSTSPDKRTTVIIPRHTRIPCKVEKNYANKYDHQTTMTFDLYQGENEFVKDNVFLGDFRITNLTPALAGKSEVHVTFAIDRNGILNVSSKEIMTWKENEVVGDRTTLIPHLNMLHQTCSQEDTPHCDAAEASGTPSMSRVNRSTKMEVSVINWLRRSFRRKN